MSGETDLLRKIQGLLSKAEGTDNENEAAAFFAKASELMVKYAIDEQRVREAMGASARLAAECPVKVNYMYSTNDSNAVGKKQLLHVVARAHAVRFIDYGNGRYSNMGREGNGTYVASQWGALIGFASDVELVKMLYVSLLVQGARFGHESAGRMRAGRSRFMTGFLVGFAGRLAERFREIAGQVPQDSTALIVRRDAEVDDATREFFPRLAHGRSHRVDFAGQLAGKAAGDRANLGQPSVRSGALTLGSGL